MPPVEFFVRVTVAAASILISTFPCISQGTRITKAKPAIIVLISSYAPCRRADRLTTNSSQILGC
jgi:hypothetical protein